MILRGVSCAFAALFCFLAAELPGYSNPHPTTVEKIDFHGWHDSYRISNGIVDVVVVPSIGRIMQYCFTGHPETSPLWINPAEEGKAPDGAWRNYGGDKIWPAPQGDWGKYMHQDRNWPPDPAIDPGDFTLTRVKDGVRLTGTPSRAFGISIDRQIALSPGGTQLRITDTFIRPKTAMPNDLPIALWEVTQTRGDETAYLPFDRNSKSVAGGFVAIDEGTPNPSFRGSNWTIGDGMMTITTQGLKRGDKVGVDDNMGLLWEIGPYDKFKEEFKYDESARYLDNRTDAQVYANDNPPYIEIEVHSSGRVLRPGGSISKKVTWSLLHPGQ